MPRAKIGWAGAWGFIQQQIAATLVVRPRDLREYKAPHQWLYFFENLDLEKVGRGLFIPTGWPVDPLMILLRKYPRLTVGAMSALWLHGLIDRPQHDWCVMGPSERMPSHPHANARYLRSTWPHEDRTEVKFQETPVHAQTPIRAVLDCVRFRKRIGQSVVTALVKLMLTTNAVDRDLLILRAGELHVLTPLCEILKRR